MNPINDTPDEALPTNTPQADVPSQPAQPIEFINPNLQSVPDAPMGSNVEPVIDMQQTQPTVGSQPSPLTQANFAPPSQPILGGQPQPFATQPAAQQPSFAGPMPGVAPMQNMQTPGLASAYNDKTAPGVTLGIISIIAAIIFPLGFILGVISVIKGFASRPGNKILGVLGIIGILASITAGYFAVRYVLNEYKYKSFLTATGSYTPIGGEEAEYTFDYPKQFTKGTQDAEDLVNYEHVLDDEDSSVVSEIALSFSSASASISIEELETILVQDEFKESFKKLLEEELDAENLVIASIDTDFKHEVGDATLVEFTYNSKGENAKGELMLVADANSGVNYSMYLVSVEEVWDMNTEAWDTIKTSLNKK